MVDGQKNIDKFAVAQANARSKTKPKKRTQIVLIDGPLRSVIIFILFFSLDIKLIDAAGSACKMSNSKANQLYDKLYFERWQSIQNE